MADLLCIPIVAYVVRAVMRQWQASPRFELTWPMLVFLVVQCSVVFEVWLPRTSARFTADGWDVLCYTLGALIYASLFKKANRLVDT